VKEHHCRNARVWHALSKDFTVLAVFTTFLAGNIRSCCDFQLLIYDTQRVVGGKNRRYQLSPEEYIAGALQIYLDIVYLFIILLSCFKT